MVLYTDPTGVTHQVNVLERRAKTSTIEYLDNAKRGETWKNGRRYNHATRVRVVVYNTELKSN
jgi:hypothetical protein